MYLFVVLRSFLSCSHYAVFALFPSPFRPSEHTARLRFADVPLGSNFSCAMRLFNVRYRLMYNVRKTNSDQLNQLGIHIITTTTRITSRKNYLLHKILIL